MASRKQFVTQIETHKKLLSVDKSGENGMTFPFSLSSNGKIMSVFVKYSRSCATQIFDSNHTGALLDFYSSAQHVVGF